MEDVFTTEFLWIAILGGGVIGLVVLAKAPELLVAVLLVGPEYIQLVLTMVGYPVSRRAFAAAGAVVFIPVVLLFLVARMMQAREREPIIGRPNLSFVFTAIILGVWLLIGLTYSDSTFCGPRKTSEYFVFGLAPMFLAFVFLRDRAAVRRFLVWTLCVAGSFVLIASGYSIATQGTIFAPLPFIPVPGEVFEIPGHAALSGALVISLGATFALSASRKGPMWRALPVVVLPVVALYIVLAGTRSNLVSFLLVTSVGLWFTFKGHRGALVAALLVLVVTGALLVMYSPTEVQERMFSSWIEAGTRHGGAGAERIEFLKSIPALFAQAPVIGNGTGAWPLLYFKRDMYMFPHNMFAEILVENGVVGLFLVLMLWFLVVRRVWHHLMTAEPGTGLYGVAVFGGSLLVIEMTNALAHFGIAHGSCAFLLTSAITLRASFLEEEAVLEEEHPAEEEVDTLVRPVLRAGPLA